MSALGGGPLPAGSGDASGVGAPRGPGPGGRGAAAGGGVWIVAHRGASLAAQENTLEAFRLAEVEGADAVELDVQPTADGELVVFHDWELDRLCGERGAIRELRLSEVRKLRTGGHPIPTLEEVVASEARPPGLVVELKSRAWNDVLVAALAAKVLRRTRAAERGRVIVSSFNPICLLTLRRVAPELPRALLAHGKLSLPLRRLWGQRLVGASQLHLEGAMIGRAHVEAAARAGREVVAWTVNEAAEARRLASIGVHGLITDAPAAIRAALDAEPGQGSVAEARA